MKHIHFQIALILLLLTQMFSCQKDDNPLLLDSPDQQVWIEIINQENSSDGLMYSVHFKEDGSYRQILDPSPLGIDRDDTRYIAGYPGKDVVIARKKDQRWYIGGINGEGYAKDLTIDLSLTGGSPKTVELIVDGNSSRELQRNIIQTEDGKLTIYMAPYGGFAGYWE